MAFLRTMHERIKQGMALALELLSASAAIRVQPPDGGYYLFPEIIGWHDEETLVLHLLEHGVLVHPGYFYGYEQGIRIVISCLTQPDQLRAGIERLIAALAP